MALLLVVVMCSIDGTFERFDKQALLCGKGKKHAPPVLRALMQHSLRAKAEVGEAPVRVAGLRGKYGI